MRKLYLPLAFGLILMLVSSCENKDILQRNAPEEKKEKVLKVEAISLNKEEYTLQLGESFTLIAQISPKDLKEVELVWESNASEVAEVSSSGEVKALKEGEALISVHPKGQRDIRSACRFIVQKKAEEQPKADESQDNPKKEEWSDDGAKPKDAPEDQPQDKPKPDAGSDDGAKPKDAPEDQPQDKPKPDAGSDDSAKPKDAPEDQPQDNPKPDAGSDDGAKPKDAPEDQPNSYVAVTGVSVDLEPASFEVGRPFQMVGVVFPANATNKRVKWSTSNPSVATISEDGVVTALSMGQVSIIVTSEDGSKSYKTREVRVDRFRLRKGDPYRNLVAKDVNGKPISLEQYVKQGHYILLDFWGSWCGPCKRALPKLREIHNKYKDSGLIVLGVVTGEPMWRNKNYVENSNIDWPQIADDSDQWGLARVYDFRSTPHAVLLNPRGEIEEYDISVYSADFLLAEILRREGKL